MIAPMQSRLTPFRILRPVTQPQLRPTLPARFVKQTATTWGVWYSFVGDGRAMTISVTDAQLDSRVSLFSGSNCDQLFCVGHNTKGFRDNSSELTFLSELGTDYRFLVSGVSGSTGTFAVSVVVSQC